MVNYEQQLTERIEGFKKRIHQELHGFDVLDISGYITPLGNGFLVDDVVVSVSTDFWKNPFSLSVGYDNDRGRISYQTRGEKLGVFNSPAWRAVELDEEDREDVESFFERLSQTQHPGSEAERVYTAFSSLTEQANVLEAMYRSFKGHDFAFAEQVHIVRPYSAEDRQEIWDHAQTLHPQEYRDHTLNSILNRTVRGLLRRPLLGFEAYIGSSDQKKTVFWDGSSFYYLFDGTIEVL